MLNRLMFVYFIQRQGFLDGDRDYLRNRLRALRARRGKDRFHSFYRHFLLRLFHEGLGGQDRSSELDALLGTVPYLNGGLFDLHQLERENPDIQIADEAFEDIFAFFDDFDWHLDDRPLRNDKEINPDVLGYIFEKYVNQKQMGAYYTKEDITEYIGKNTILPFLFDAARKECAVAFRPDGFVWGLLRQDPDRYIYPAVRHGVDQPLPPEVAAGLDDVARRAGRDRPAAPAYALPTETWREHVARRRRCEEVRARLRAGEVQAIDDLITLNLDIRQFAQDAIESSEGPELVHAFYHAIARITVLDPTCGSGAFLFAALNILEPLYDACLERMEGFLADLDRSGAKHRPEKLSDFRKTLAQVARHPNRRYFIYKSIVLNNLYGVDIMEEAVEICKLRLFLKLVAQVERAEEIEPLPDIDFNIRAGNTLVGFATYAEAERAVTSKLDFDKAMPRIAERAEVADRAFRIFHQMQTEHGMDAKQFREAKQELTRRLAVLREELDRYLASEYGIDKNYYQRDYTTDLAKWRSSHQPFHWFVEFYRILAEGGFDVVIGNPPYVEYSKVRQSYTVHGYSTERCGNLYAYTVERSLNVMQHAGRMGMIVPLSLTFSRDFAPLRAMLLDTAGYLQVSSYDNIPDRLFTGAKESENTSKANQQRITIFLLNPSHQPRRVDTSPLMRWKAVERDRLFESLPLADTTELCSAVAFPKVGSQKMKAFLKKWETHPKRLSDLLTSRGKFGLVVPKTAGYYIAAYIDEMERTQQTWISFRTAAERDLAMVLLNSNAFFWLWRVYGDSFHVTTTWIGLCPVFEPQDNEYLSIAAALYEALPSCTVYKGYRGVAVPNVNYNQRMDLLWQADKWIIRHVAPELGLSPADFLWGKSNSLFTLEIPKAANLPVELQAIVRTSKIE